ncbi:restriction endonuclease subunit S [Streptococcus mutans]|uniref:restriction endonuclease subunit S n=1 Tax=Streptococcus mutans TaxID=1309 RepID=UPI0014556042|nr:restriction endonuclease subunit S [Streptococcus mutans]NLQ50449.1 restriction endonuclease subunit S [Streptococcus mutans]
MSKLKLTDVEWREFKVGELFDTNNRGRRLTNSSREYGNIPFVTAGESNNGISSFIYNLNHKKYSEAITLDMFGHSFYQAFEFKCDDNITVLKNENLNKYSSLFMVNLLNRLQEKYSYGNQVRPNRLKKDIIMLPIDSQGQPNWKFMEDYIEQEQKAQAQQVIDYYERKLIELAGDVVGLDKVEWKTFQFTEVFQKIQRGKRLTKANQTDGLKPYISSTSDNNGVDAFIGNETGVRKFEDVLTLANSGSVGSTFYQQFEFVASDHVTALKSENADKYAYLFLSTVVKRLEEKYSFNREINDARIKREKVVLPADKNGNPDFRYMSDFVKKLELDKVQEVLEYIYIYIYQTEDNA